MGDAVVTWIGALLGKASATFVVVVTFVWTLRWMGVAI